MQGSLGEFRLAEILQLVAVQQKTGLLRLVRGSQAVTFYFDHGILVSTRDRRHASADPLLDYVARTGWVQPEIASFLSRRVDGTKLDVADLLVEERFLSEEELAGVLVDLAQEIVQQTFAWRDGTYQFIGGDGALSGLRHRLRLQVDGVLMEAARRADEWPRLQEKLPSPEVVVEVAQPPHPGLGERPFQVLSHINGRVRMSQLVASCRVPEFEVYEIVAQASEMGLVRVVEKPPPRPPAPEPHQAAPPKPPKARRQIHIPLAWTRQPIVWALALAFALVSAAGTRFVAPYLRADATRATLHAQATAEARESIRLQIEIYRDAHGTYPQQLADLVADDLVSTRLLARGAPLRYTLAADGRSFVLDVPGSASRPPGR